MFPLSRPFQTYADHTVLNSDSTLVSLCVKKIITILKVTPTLFANTKVTLPENLSNRIGAELTKGEQTKCPKHCVDNLDKLLKIGNIFLTSPFFASYTILPTIKHAPKCPLPQHLSKLYLTAVSSEGKQGLTNLPLKQINIVDRDPHNCIGDKDPSVINDSEWQFPSVQLLTLTNIAISPLAAPSFFSKFSHVQKVEVLSDLSWHWRCLSQDQRISSADMISYLCSCTTLRSIVIDELNPKSLPTSVFPSVEELCCKDLQLTSPSAFSPRFSSLFPKLTILDVTIVTGQIPQLEKNISNSLKMLSLHISGICTLNNATLVATWINSFSSSLEHLILDCRWSTDNENSLLKSLNPLNFQKFTCLTSLEILSEAEILLAKTHRLPTLKRLAVIGNFGDAQKIKTCFEKLPKTLEHVSLIQTNVPKKLTDAEIRSTLNSIFSSAVKIDVRTTNKA